MAKKMYKFLFLFLSIFSIITPIKSENSYVTKAAIGVVAVLVGTTLAGLAYKYFTGVRSQNYSGFVFFWQVDKDVMNGREIEVTYNSSCLSQWYPSPFTAFNKDFKTAEHFMMYFKALHFAVDSNWKNNLEVANNVLTARTGKDAKLFGKKVKLVSAEWDKFSKFYVYAGNMEKFSQNKGLKNYLLSTGNRFLAEASPLDKVWGIGLESDNPKAIIRSQWQGSNKLGYILMMVRSELQKSEKDQFRPAVYYTTNKEFIAGVKNSQSEMMRSWKKLSDEYKNSFGMSSDWRLLPGKK